MMPNPDKPARDILDFYLEAGVDALVGEEPVDRFAGEQTNTATRTVTSPLAGEVGEQRSPGGGYTTSSNSSRLPPSPTLPQVENARTRVNPSSVGGGSEKIGRAHV